MVEQLSTCMCEGEHTPQFCRQVDDDAQSEMGLAGLNSWLMYKQKKIVLISTKWQQPQSDQLCTYIAICLTIIFMHTLIDVYMKKLQCILVACTQHQQWPFQTVHLYTLSPTVHCSIPPVGPHQSSYLPPNAPCHRRGCSIYL